MIEIRPNVLYTKTDLAQLLEGTGLDVDHFLARLATRKVFKSLWKGSDLLEAYDRAEALNEAPAPAPQVRRSGRGRSRPAASARIRIEEIGVK